MTHIVAFCVHTKFGTGRCDLCCTYSKYSIYVFNMEIFGMKECADKLL